VVELGDFFVMKNDLPPTFAWPSTRKTTKMYMMASGGGGRTTTTTEATKFFTIYLPVIAKK